MPRWVELVAAKSVDSYCTQLLDRFGRCEAAASSPNAVEILRKALVDSSRAVICAIGPLTNIAALLESSRDGISELDGVSLVREKCERIVVMAGGFVVGDDGRNTPEWNVKLDPFAFRTLLDKAPVPIAFLPFETGLNMYTGAPIMEKYGGSNPLSYSFQIHCKGNKKGRHSWDPATLLYAVEGLSDRFVESARGRVTVDRDGRTELVSDPEGRHTVIGIRSCEGEAEQDRKREIAAYIDACVLSLYGQI